MALMGAQRKVGFRIPVSANSDRASLLLALWPGIAPAGTRERKGLLVSVS